MKKVISTSNAPAAIGPYSQAIEAGNLVFLSGMLPIDPFSGNMVTGNIAIQTEQILKNIEALLKQAGCSMGQVVKTTVFLTDMALFSEMNEVYARYFTNDYPARSAVAVKELPKKSQIEIEVIAMK